MIRTAFAALLLGVSLTASARATTQRDLDSFARGLGVRLTILDNAPPKCPGGREGCFLSEIDLRVPQDLSADLSRGKFALYFNSVAPVFALESDTFSVRHINGDLHVIEPRAGAPVVPGSRHRMNLWSQGHFFSAFYPMPNMFLASEGLQARTVEATRPVIDRESGLERLPFVAPMTDEAKLATAGAGDDTK
ncbi:MAG: carbohydate-binding domain-containing protein, partial [Sphingomicrobium sp.]